MKAKTKSDIWGTTVVLTFIGLAILTFFGCGAYNVAGLNENFRNSLGILATDGAQWIEYFTPGAEMQVKEMMKDTPEITAMKAEIAKFEELLTKDPENAGVYEATLARLRLELRDLDTARAPEVADAEDRLAAFKLLPEALRKMGEAMGKKDAPRPAGPPDGGGG